MVKAWVTFKMQKNQRHGERKLLTSNENGDFDYVEASLRCVERFIRLCGEDDTTTPLSVYRDPKTNRVKLINARDVERAMRFTASRVYGLDPVEDAEKLKKWSSHSLRVGACVILYAMGFTETNIKFILRWRSDAFFEYLRNVAVVCKRHNEAIDLAGTIPNLI